MYESPKSPKNIIICCDGTGNQYGNDNSNVVKLYSCLLVNSDQVAYYHPGVGTMGDPRKTSWIGKTLSKIGGLAFGLGFTDNIADAYRFIMDQYADGDRIYLFGFSRGAYTVRALAGALYMYGLLCPGNEGHLPYLLDMFSDKSRDTYNKDEVKQLQALPSDDGFRETFSRTVPIYFMGVWDTVSSVGGIYDPVKLLYDGQNPIVRKVRHAISVDERRCFFQANLLGHPLPPSRTPVLEQFPDPADHQQDIVQAWFAGVHSDVGGSYDQSESHPAMDALKWMLNEACVDSVEDDKGIKYPVLLVNKDKRDAVYGLASAKYPALSAMNKRAKEMNRLHDSLTWKWMPLEAFPHKYFDQNGKKSWRYTPWPHSRELPDGALLHPSLLHRLTNDKKYNPKNIDKTCIKDYASSPVDLPQPHLMAGLKDQGFGVYRPPVKSSSTIRTAARVTALLCIGIAARFFSK
jgi:uncharacterized protein (DUF2235 family)